MSEQVWCVPAEAVHRARPAPGFWPAASPTVAMRLAEEGRYLPRESAEHDETWRQVIPYVLLRAAGRYFVYRRLRGGGEARLFDLHSLGVGGHINGDGEGDRLVSALHRELDEELHLPAGALIGLSLHGYLALDETPVDRVHVGVVAVAEIAPPAARQVDVRETDKLAAVGWFTSGELRGRLGEWSFEGWSRTLIEAGLP